MRRLVLLVGLMALTASLLPPVTAAAPPENANPSYKILVFTAGTTMSSNAENALKAIAKTNHAAVVFTADAAKINRPHLQQYRAVIFLNTGVNILNAAQKQAFEDYFRAGGGFVGIGSAIETEPDWSFLTEVLGTRASSRTDVQPGTVKVADRGHDATKNLPEYWTRTDAWYNFTSNVRGQSHVLATVVELADTRGAFAIQPWGGTLTGIIGGSMGFDHPVAWCKDWKGGRSFYIAGGNTSASYNEAGFRAHIAGAIEWAAGQSNPVYSDCGATVLANYQQTKVSGPPNLSEPIGFDVLPDNRVIQTDRRGGVRLHNPVTNSTTLLATVPVYTNSEDGMYGPAIDNDFATNHWVYLYYAPPTVTVTQSDGVTRTITTNPTGSAPNTGATLATWDPWLGYFQLSRFKFVDATATDPAHLDLATEQQILRVPNNRGACCHVAGDIDFDKHGNLWMVTGDDTPAGGGNSGGFGPFNGQLTNETQTIAISGATGGTFTLTFEGQTTAPIAFPLVNTAIESALEALPNVDDVTVTGTGTRSVRFDGPLVSERDVAQMTANAAGLTGTSPTVTIATTAAGGLFNAPHVDARRSALNTNDLRGKILRFAVKAGDISEAEANQAGGAYTIPAGNLFAPGTTKTRPEIYAMGFRNPFRIQVDENDVAYITDYSPDSTTPTVNRGPAGTGRVEVVRKPSNYGWPVCYKTDLAYYRWNFNTTAPLDNPPQKYVCDDPTRGPQNDSRWNLLGGPTVEPGLEYGPPITNPEVWYSFQDNNSATNPLGTPCSAYYDGTLPAEQRFCPRLFPELGPGGGVGPHGAAKYHFDPANSDRTKFPAYYDNAIFFGEFTRDTLREIRLDSQNRVFKINNLLNCGQALITTPFEFECDNPMDMQFDGKGHFYLLTYGDGFFNINADAGMYRWDYVKGQRAPSVVLTATPTNGTVPLTVEFSSAGTADPDPGDSIRFEWDFDGNGTVDSIDPNPSFTYLTRGVFTAKLTVLDSSGNSVSANTTITVGNTAPSLVVVIPTDGGTFAFGDNIPFAVTVTDPEDGPINCSEVAVTFVLGHDTHGHAEATVNGCSGVLPTDVADASHGGNVFGVISASYTDHGGSGGVPSLTTVSQNQIRQKHQEVEFVVNQSGTNTAATSDVGGGLHRGSLSNGDWLQLNGPFNFLNITDVTFRVADAANGRTPGSPLASVDIRRDAVDGPIVVSADLTSTGGTAAWSSQTVSLADSGAHEYFVVIRSVAGGSTGNNLFNLNWIEFVGPGVSGP